jgi:hypothetical protein
MTGIQRAFCWWDLDFSSVLAMTAGWRASGGAGAVHAQSMQ